MTPPYTPLLDEYCDILKDYSLSGLKYFHSLAGKMQEDVKKTFGALIEDKDGALQHKFSEVKKRRAVALRLIPMPKPSGTDFAISFFVPRFEFLNAEGFQCAFCLIAWINHDGGKTVAFRLEPSGADTSSHSYSHHQLSLRVNSPDFLTSLEQWTPQSYPAFPIGFSTPLHFFVATTVAIHGYSRRDRTLYVIDAMKAAMQTGNAALRGRKIIDEIHRLFG